MVLKLDMEVGNDQYKAHIDVKVIRSKVTVTLNMTHVFNNVALRGA